MNYFDEEFELNMIIHRNAGSGNYYHTVGYLDCYDVHNEAKRSLMWYQDRLVARVYEKTREPGIHRVEVRAYGMLVVDKFVPKEAVAISITKSFMEMYTVCVLYDEKGKVVGDDRNQLTFLKRWLYEYKHKRAKRRYEWEQERCSCSMKPSTSKR